MYAIRSYYAPQLAALIGASVSISAVGSWYAGLEKPFFNPPAWIFGPVWTVLYIFMGVASYLVWRCSTSPWYSRTMTWYWMQLTLNALWSPAFFVITSYSIHYTKLYDLHSSGFADVASGQFLLKRVQTHYFRVFQIFTKCEIDELSAINVMGIGGETSGCY